MLSQQGRKEENGLMILSRNTWNPANCGVAIFKAQSWMCYGTCAIRRNKRKKEKRKNVTVNRRQKLSFMHKMCGRKER